jgi:hypothetical protein
MAARMHDLFERIRTRVVPAIVTAAGISLLAAGLMTYSSPVQAVPPGSASDGPSGAPSFGLLTMPPFPSAHTSARPSQRVVTRVMMPALGIDLPVVKPPAGFPYCDVAMYLDSFSVPGEPGATYLFAHARTGMFLPLLTRSMQNNGASMIDMLVQVYTSDDMLWDYRVVQVRRHYPASGILQSLPTKSDQLWLQTSEGPLSSSPKMQVVAQLLASAPADHAAAHPKAHPRVCA